MKPKNSADQMLEVRDVGLPYVSINPRELKLSTTPGFVTILGWFPSSCLGTQCRKLQLSVFLEAGASLLHSQAGAWERAENSYLTLCLLLVRNIPPVQNVAMRMGYKPRPLTGLIDQTLNNALAILSESCSSTNCGSLGG